MSAFRASWIAAVTALLVPMSAIAQAEHQKKPRPILADPTRIAISAASLVGGHERFGILPKLNVCQRTIWTNEEDDINPPPPDKPPTIPDDMLSQITDSTKVLHWSENEHEHPAYCLVLYEAWRTPAAAFSKAARRDVTFAHVFKEPKKYRGEVIHIEGRVKRIRHYEPPLNARQAGVKDVYEAWIFDKQYGADPWCVLVTELPKGIKPAEEIDDTWVSADGYFFKIFRYKAADNLKANQFREAPLIIGHSLIVQAAPQPSKDSSWSDNLLAAFVGLIVVTGLLAVGLAWWFHRGDKSIRSRLARNGATEFIPPAPHDDDNVS